MAKIVSVSIVALIAMLTSLIMMRAHASDIKSDEQVILFTTNAHLVDGGTSWEAPVHGWIFEPEEDSIWRSAFASAFVKSLGLDESAIREETFRKRAAMFLVDNERNKILTINIGTQQVRSEKSKPNGHFFARAQVSSEEVGSDCSRCVNISIVTPSEDVRQFSGRIQLIGESGISVVSDIDDTIKVSDVSDKQELIKNTFIKPFQAVSGMPEIYSSWEKQGAAFHYVSSSPWQLYPFLNEFIENSALPRGSFHLKQFRIKDQSFFDLFASPMESKVPTISGIIKQYPERRFVLVGDSGEEDPEVYARIFRTHKDQIHHICIRNVTNESAESQRYKDTFSGISPDLWTVFEEPSDLKKIRIP